MSLTVAPSVQDAFAHAPRRAAWDRAIDAGVALLCVMPLLLTAHLPLTDLPNHLARQYILRDWASSPWFQQFYDIHWALVPNLALELFVLGARQVMSIDLAIRVFCIVTMLLLLAGTRFVNRLLGGPDARSYRAVPLLCYGGPFQYGFVSYCFGVGLALVLFGLYLRVRRRDWAWLAVLMPLSFVLLLCHLAAFGLFAIAVGGCELTCAWQSVCRPRSIRRLAAAAVRYQAKPLLMLVPVFLVFALFSPTADDSAVSAVTRFSTLHEKARGFAAITLFAAPRLEASLLILALAGLAIALFTRTLRLHAIAATGAAVMLLAWLALPLIALGGAYIDYRLPWAVSFFVLAGLLPGARHPAFGRATGCYVGALAVARILIISWLWLRWEPTLAAIDAALSQVPHGTRLMVVEAALPGGFRDPDLEHVAAYAVARSQSFEPGMFASLTGQILYFQPHYMDLADQANFDVAIPSRLDELPPDYTYILDLLPELTRIGPMLPTACEASGPQFRLLRRLPPGSIPVPCP
jgi:hypothetical protein